VGRPFVFAIAIVALVAAATAGQTPADRQRARTHNQLGWEQMTSEQWEGAARSFQQAIDIDQNYAHAYYGLGRATMALKKYVAAIDALTRCRDIYQSRVGKQFASRQDAQRARNDRLTELDEQIRQVQSMPVSIQQQELMRQLNNQRRDIQEALSRGNSLTIDGGVPPWVSLSLGSAYFRAGKIADAEREYKATLEADRRSGEAHSNLAVVYLETGRIDDAHASLQAAKKTGFKVNPQLEQVIKDRLKK